MAREDNRSRLPVPFGVQSRVAGGLEQRVGFPAGLVAHQRSGHVDHLVGCRGPDPRVGSRLPVGLAPHPFVVVGQRDAAADERRELH